MAFMHLVVSRPGDCELACWWGIATLPKDWLADWPRNAGLGTLFFLRIRFTCANYRSVPQSTIMGLTASIGLFVAVSGFSPMPA